MLYLFINVCLIIVLFLLVFITYKVDKGKTNRDLVDNSITIHLARGLFECKIMNPIDLRRVGLLVDIKERVDKTDGQISNSKFLATETGGHLKLGHKDRIKKETSNLFRHNYYDVYIIRAGQFDSLRPACLIKTVGEEATPMSNKEQQVLLQFEEVK